MINTTLGLVTPGVGNRLKAAFAQFLWLRHGGSGYLFGHGNGHTGQNSSVITVNSNNTLYNNQPIPSERPFRSLSFPDINYTVMRPAAPPPSTYSAPAMIPNSNAVTNAQALISSPPASSLPSTWYFLNSALGAGALPEFYAPYVTPNAIFSATSPVVLTGDPGVRNPYFSPGYVPSQYTGTPPYTVATAPGTPANTVPAGVPVPVNIAFPTGSTSPPATMYSAADLLPSRRPGYSRPRTSTVRERS